MTTVAQMIAWMQTLPQDAEVQCGVEITGSYYTEMRMRPVDLTESGSAVYDYSSEEDRAKYPSMAGRVIVEIHGE